MQHGYNMYMHSVKLYYVIISAIDHNTYNFSNTINEYVLKVGIPILSIKYVAIHKCCS